MSILQKIQDDYIKQGIRGNELEKALKKDKKYQEFFRKHREKTKKLHKFATKKDMEKFPLPVEEDFIILDRVKKLKGKKLEKNDREIVELIYSQLELHWREELLKKLNKLSKKYLR